MKKLFGTRLKNLRLNEEETQLDLAEILKVDKSMICLWENGKNYPEVKKLIEISFHYNVSIDLFIRIKR